MDYMSNTFASDQDSIRMTDLFKIASSILKRELSQEEKDRLYQLIPNSSRCGERGLGADGMVEKVKILSLIYRVSDRVSWVGLFVHHSLRVRGSPLSFCEDEEMESIYWHCCSSTVVCVLFPVLQVIYYFSLHSCCRRDANGIFLSYYSMKGEFTKSTVCGSFLCFMGSFRLKRMWRAVMNRKFPRWW